MRMEEALSVIGNWPAELVARRVVLHLDEVSLGFEQGLLDPRAVVDLEVRYLQSGVSLTSLEMSLACLLGNELECVNGILG